MSTVTEARFHPFAKKSQGKDSITCAPLRRFYSFTSKIVETDVVDYLKVFARDAKLGRNDQ